MTAAAPTIAMVAADYARRGWKPIPVGRRSKKPIGKGWQNRPFDPAQFDGNAQNVAIQLGAASHGLCDVDLDSMLAVGFAPEFLPPTDAIFGHASKPASHQIYNSDIHNTEKRAVLKFEHAGGVIVELRIGADNRGATTVFPPSMHASGEIVEWLRDGDPAFVAGGPLKIAVTQLAVACLLKPLYPGNGLRHEGALVLGGVLARAGWNAVEIGHLVEVLARTAGDDEVADRVTTATSAVHVKANGQDVPGFDRLREIWGKDAADTLKRWLGGRTPSIGKGAGLEDSTALTFAEQHANDYRYVAKAAQWMHWARARWQAEDTLCAFDVARKLCRAAGDAKAKTVAAVERLARADRRIAATIDQWDAEPMIINTPTQVAT